MPLFHLTPAPPSLPIAASDPCPCGSDRAALSCCLRASGMVSKSPIIFAQPQPPNGYANLRCYFSFTRDCSHSLSGEHYVSESVLKILGGSAFGNKSMRAAGLAWQNSDEYT